jgi:thiol:disulfide interchange protein DsbD
VIYLMGKIRFPHDGEVQTIGGLRAMWIGLFLFLSAFLLGGLLGGELPGDVVAFVPPRAHKPNTTGEIGANGASVAPVVWHKDWDEALAAAKAQNKRLLIDFTGHN